MKYGDFQKVEGVWSVWNGADWIPGALDQNRQPVFFIQDQDYRWGPPPGYVFDVYGTAFYSPVSSVSDTNSDGDSSANPMAGWVQQHSNISAIYTDTESSPDASLIERLHSTPAYQMYGDSIHIFATPEQLAYVAPVTLTVTPVSLFSDTLAQLVSQIPINSQTPVSTPISIAPVIDNSPPPLNGGGGGTGINTAPSPDLVVRPQDSNMAVSQEAKTRLIVLAAALFLLG